MNAPDVTHLDLQFFDLRTGKRAVVPGSQDHAGGGQWVTENTLVAGDNDSKLAIFDVRTQKWSDLVPGPVINCAHLPDYKYLVLHDRRSRAESHAYQAC